MDFISQFLEKFNLKDISQITDEEKQTLLRWQKYLEQNQPTLEKFKTLIEDLKKEVENKLVDEPEFKFFFIPNRKHIFLKARLKNLIVFENFFNYNSRTAKALKEYINSL